jgi:hypothetical protein
VDAIRSAGDVIRRQRKRGASRHSFFERGRSRRRTSDVAGERFEPSAWNARRIVLGQRVRRNWIDSVVAAEGIGGAGKRRWRSVRTCHVRSTHRYVGRRRAVERLPSGGGCGRKSARAVQCDLRFLRIEVADTRAIRLGDWTSARRRRFWRRITGAWAG